MRAKSVTHKGVRFRSTLEARWAVFFDALELRWRYEPEEARRRGVYYQPDFAVGGLAPAAPCGKGPDVEIGVARLFIFEVKPAGVRLKDKDREKMRDWVRAGGELVLLRGQPAECRAVAFSARPDGRLQLTGVQFAHHGAPLLLALTRGTGRVVPRKPRTLRGLWRPDCADLLTEWCWEGPVQRARRAARNARWRKDGR